MSQERLLSNTERNERADKKNKKEKHKGKIFSSLTDIQKFEVIEDDLRSRGIID